MSDTSTSSARDVTATRRDPGVGHQSVGACAGCPARTTHRFIRGRLQQRYCAACAAAYDARKAARAAAASTTEEQ